LSTARFSKICVHCSCLRQAFIRDHPKQRSGKIKISIISDCQGAKAWAFSQLYSQSIDTVGLRIAFGFWQAFARRGATSYDNAFIYSDKTASKRLLPRRAGEQGIVELCDETFKTLRYKRSIGQRRVISCAKRRKTISLGRRSNSTALKSFVLVLFNQRLCTRAIGIKI